VEVFMLGGMNVRRQKHLAVGVILGILAGCGGRMLTAAEPATTFAPDSALKLEVRIESQELLPYEPLGVVIVVRNTATAPVHEPRDMFNNASVLIKKKGADKTYDMAAFFHGDAAWVDFAPLQAVGSFALMSIRSEWNLRGERSDFPLFAEEGTYEVVVDVKGYAAHLTSKVFEVKVRPTPEVEVAAQKIVKQNPVMLDTGRTEADVAALRDLVEKFPKSVYADYANQRLGHHFLSASRTAEGRNEEAIKKAFGYFGAVSERIKALKLDALVQQGGIMIMQPEYMGQEGPAKFLEQLKRMNDAARVPDMLRRVENIVTNPNMVGEKK
jgi:hypothetical protein